MASSTRSLLLATGFIVAIAHSESQNPNAPIDPVDEIVSAFDDTGGRSEADKKKDQDEKNEAITHIMTAEVDSEKDFWPMAFAKLGRFLNQSFKKIANGFQAMIEKLINSLAGLFGKKLAPIVEVNKKEEASAQDHTIELEKDEAASGSDRIQEVEETASLGADTKPEPIEITNSFDSQAADDENNKETTVADVVTAAREAGDAWNDYVTDMTTPGAFLERKAEERNIEELQLSSFLERKEEPIRQRRRKGALTLQKLIQDGV